MNKISSRKRVGPKLLASIGWATGAVLFIIAVGCSEGTSKKHEADARAGRSAMPVTVAEAVEKAVPVELPAVGTVDAYATVAVRTQVEGEVMEVHLREGQCVKTGDLLFTIDPRPYEARLEQMRANLAKDKAQLENARTQLERNAAVVDKGYVSQERYDQAAADAAALEATVRGDEAALENAQIQLNYCSIRSPITGCAGEVFVDQGNVVKANDAEHPLVVIKQIRPIYVGFSVPERYLPEIKTRSAAAKLPVLAAPVGGGDEPFKGELTFVDNSVNTAAGTILLKATFPNGDQALWPGQFVNVTLQLASQPRAVVVPSQAVQTGQDGRYVFLLKPDQTVEFRPVIVDRTVGGEAVIAQGLEAGNKVVTDGQLRLSAGAAVKIVAGPDYKPGYKQDQQGPQDQKGDAKP